MKKIFTCIAALTVLGTASATDSERILGGDISLVPAYEDAGDVWLDADGNSINDNYSDGLVTFLRDEGKWNSIRVRLLVDPSQDSYVATCQDIDYVKELGKRIKDAGMNFLLDIFYSDTWTDVSQQWIPADWDMDKSTDAETIAAQVKSYTTEVINELVEYGATPDFVQIGNEVSYGMLWDSMSGASMSTNAFYPSTSYSSQSTKISRFATILTAAAEGVRASNAADAKIILHSERTINATYTYNFYSYVEKAGFTDYDIIGLSYYPAWQGSLSNLESTLSKLKSSFSEKEVHIVETAYYCNEYGKSSLSTTESSYCTWDFSYAGQAEFLTDLIEVLNEYDNVTGLYYWQPEECGNGSDGTDNIVMDDWDNRGFWELSWKAGSHAFSGSASLEAMKAFIEDSDDDEEETTTTVDVSSTYFTNLDFESTTFTDGSATEIPGWSWIWDTSVTNKINTLWVFETDTWTSSLVDGYFMKGWTPADSATVNAGKIIFQTSASELPAGTYTVTAAVHTDLDGFYLYANDDEKEVVSTSDWGTAYTTTVTTELTEAGYLEIGLKLDADATLSSEWNFYADNFTVSQITTSTAVQDIKADTVERNWPEGIYDLSGRRVTEAKRGLYIINGKKTLVK